MLTLLGVEAPLPGAEVVVGSEAGTAGTRGFCGLVVLWDAVRVGAAGAETVGLAGVEDDEA